MIPSERAGVPFALHRQTERPDELIAELGVGLDAFDFEQQGEMIVLRRQPIGLDNLDVFLTVHHGPELDLLPSASLVGSSLSQVFSASPKTTGSSLVASGK